MSTLTDFGLCLYFNGLNDSKRHSGLSWLFSPDSIFRVSTDGRASEPLRKRRKPTGRQSRLERRPDGRHTAQRRWESGMGQGRREGRVLAGADQVEHRGAQSAAPPIEQRTARLLASRGVQGDELRVTLREPALQGPGVHAERSRDLVGGSGPRPGDRTVEGVLGPLSEGSPLRLTTCSAACAQRGVPFGITALDGAAGQAQGTPDRLYGAAPPLPQSGGPAQGRPGPTGRPMHVDGTDRTRAYRNQDRRRAHPSKDRRRREPSAGRRFRPRRGWPAA